MEDYINGLMENMDPEKTQSALMLGEQMAQEMISMLFRHNETLKGLPETESQIAYCAYVENALKTLTEEDSHIMEHLGPGLEAIINSFSEIEE